MFDAVCAWVAAALVLPPLLLVLPAVAEAAVAAKASTADVASQTALQEVSA
jgi:hypothetical protein